MDNTSFWFGSSISFYDENLKKYFFFNKKSTNSDYTRKNDFSNFLVKTYQSYEYFDKVEEPEVCFGRNVTIEFDHLTLSLFDSIEIRISKFSWDFGMGHNPSKQALEVICNLSFDFMKLNLRRFFPGLTKCVNFLSRRMSYDV